MVRTWQVGLFGGLGLVTAIGAILYLFWAPVRSDVTSKTTNIASDVLSDAAVKEKALEVTKAVVEGVLKDDASVDLLVDIIGRLLQQPSSVQVVALYLKSLFEDRYTQEISKHFVLTVVQDPWVYDQLGDVAVSLALDLLKNETTREAMKSFLVTSAVASLKDESLQATAGSAIRGAALTAVNPLSGLTSKLYTANATNGSNSTKNHSQPPAQATETAEASSPPSNAGVTGNNGGENAKQSHP